MIKPSVLAAELEKGPLTPEGRLCLAVIYSAFHDYRRWDRVLKAEARKWFKNLETDAPFSFRYCCQAIGAEPDAVMEILFTKEVKQRDESRTTLLRRSF